MIACTTETGRKLTAPSEEALEAGWDFYNNPKNSKEDFIKYCADHGVSIIEATDDPYFNGEKMVDDWADVVAYTFANHGRAK